MFIEYKDHKGIDVPILSKILVENRSENSAIVFEGPNVETSIAVIEFDLILAFKFLIDALADASVPMDAYLAECLRDWNVSFKKEVMAQFVKFRVLNGLSIPEDEAFYKTKDLEVYIVDEKCKECGKARSGWQQ